MLLGHAVRPKNAEATYQRAMTVIFKKMLRDIVEWYVDDLSLNRDEGMTT